MNQMQTALEQAGFTPAFTPPEPSLGGYLAELRAVRRYYHTLRRQNYSVEAIRRAFAKADYLLTGRVLSHPEDPTAQILI